MTLFTVRNLASDPRICFFAVQYAVYINQLINLSYKHTGVNEVVEKGHMKLPSLIYYIPSKFLGQVAIKCVLNF